MKFNNPFFNNASPFYANADASNRYVYLDVDSSIGKYKFNKDETFTVRTNAFFQNEYPDWRNSPLKNYRVKFKKGDVIAVNKFEFSEGSKNAIFYLVEGDSNSKVVYPLSSLTKVSDREEESIPKYEEIKDVHSQNIECPPCASAENCPPCRVVESSSQATKKYKFTQDFDVKNRVCRPCAAPPPSQKATNCGCEDVILKSYKKGDLIEGTETISLKGGTIIDTLVSEGNKIPLSVLTDKIDVTPPTTTPPTTTPPTTTPKEKSVFDNIKAYLPDTLSENDKQIVIGAGIFLGMVIIYKILK